MKCARMWMVAVATWAMGWGAASGSETVLDSQGSWRLVQADGGTVKSLFLARDGSDARTRLASVEVPSATVTNVYWDEFAAWDAAAGRPVGGMVTNVDTVAGEYTFHAFVNDGNVYWEDRADGVPRLWTAPCTSPESKTLLATGDAGCPAGTSAFGAEPWNRGAAWTEAGADGETMAVFENGATTRLSGEAALAARGKATRDGTDVYETDYGYVDSGSWFPPYSGWQSEFHDRQTVLIPDGVERIGMGVFANCTNLEHVTIPDSVTSIGWGAFLGCSGLTGATIPDSVTDIDAAAFRQCSGMTNLLIGEGVTRIGYYAFDGCRSLASVTILGNVASDWAILDESHDYRLFKNCTNLSTVVLGEKMTKIGNYMFSGCSGLTSVTIPDGVTSIGNRAFSGCSGLTSVTIPDSVTRIGDMVFSGCNGLKTLYVPAEWEGTDMLSDADVPSSCTVVYAAAEGHVDETGWSYVVQGGKAKVTGGPAEGTVIIPSVLGGYPVTSIGNGAFSDSTGLTGVTIPGSVTRIGDKAFSGCSGLVSVTILGNVQNDWNGWYDDEDWIPPPSPFTHCPNLATVVLDGKVTKIGSSMFYGCSGLTSVTIPDSVTSIGDRAFSGCGGLTSVTIGEGVTSIGENAFYGCSGLTSVTIPDSVKSFGDAFSWCSGLTNVTIGAGVTSIEYGAFSGCSGLTSMTIPDSISRIGDYAFFGCSGLASVVIGNGVTRIGCSAFSECDGLTSVHIHDLSAWCGIAFDDGDGGAGVVNPLSYAHHLFLEGEEVTDLVIPDGVTRIGYKAFDRCIGLTNVTVPNSVKNIGREAFYDCSGLTSVTIGNGVTNIGYNAFSGCTALTGVTIGDSVTSIRDEAFSRCSGLTSVTIPDSVTSIGDYAFRGCSGLTSATIGNGVTNIGCSAFSECDGLTGVTIPDSVTSIGDEAFSGCSGLTRVTIGDSVTSIGSSAFYACSGLNAFSVASGNPAYQSVSGLLLTKDGKTLLCGVNGNVVIPASVTSIGNGAFSGRSALTSVTIPDSVTSIGGSAFYGCSGLTSVTILGNVTNDWRYSDSAPFRGCTNIATLVLGEKMTKIGTNMFSGCSGLTSVTIPDSVTSIGDYAFEDCSGLKTLSVPGAWEGTTMLRYAGVPSGCEVVYRKGGGDLLPEAGSEAEVAAALAGAADGRLGERIRSVGEYAAFRAWAAAKGLDAAAVLGSAHAWISYALGAEKLFGNEPEIVLGEMSVGRDGAKGAEIGVAVEVSVAVKDGGTAVAVDASKVAGMFEATGNLGDWGGAGIPVSVTQTGSEGSAMKFEVVLGDGTAGEAFLRLTMKQLQTISFAPIGAKTTADRVELSATATSGGAVMFEVVSGPGVIAGNMLSFTGAGTVVVQAVQAGNDLWRPATATQTVVVEKVAQTIAFASIGTQTTQDRVTLSATATSGGTVTFEVVSGPGVIAGSMLSFTGVGTVTVRAVQAGNDLWLPATATQTVQVEEDFGRQTYMVVDLLGLLTPAGDPDWHPVSYLRDEPEGGWTDDYKGRMLVLRRIEQEAGAYYIGVFEVTQEQWYCMTGDYSPSKYRGETRPVENVDGEAIETFLGKLREWTGLAFALPTDEQWEYACRAGTTSLYNDGGNYSLEFLGRYAGNRGDGEGWYSEHTVVGSYEPNAWGLYDMHGNVWEWTSDKSGNRLRGGGWNSDAWDCTSESYQDDRSPSEGYDDSGFRVALP